MGLGKKIEPKDIQQGQVGDCYFLASISSIIYNHPELIHNKILFDVNNAHYYVVKFFIDGEWQYIVTDDKFPYENKRAIFARPHDN